MNYSKYMDMQEEITLVEKELVTLIVEHLKSNRIAVEAARQQARDFLALLPMKDQIDLLNKLKGLSEKYEEAKEIYAEELGKVYEAKRQEALEQMRAYIKQGNMDSAIAAAKALYPEKNGGQGGITPTAPVQETQPDQAATPALVQSVEPQPSQVSPSKQQKGAV